MIPAADFVETREKTLFRAFRTSKSALASDSAVLLIPAAEFVETREKETNFGPRNSFFRVSDLEKHSGIIFGCPVDSRGRVCRSVSTKRFSA